MQELQTVGGLELFQSAPVIADGRAGARLIFGVCLGLFQSAPVIADGRAPSPPCFAPPRTLFQSAPVIADGRALPAIVSLMG